VIRPPRVSQVHPVLVELFGGVSIGTHQFFVGLGVLAAGVVIALEARRRTMWNEDLLIAVSGGLVGGALGMRASGLVRSLDPASNPSLLTAWQYGAKSVLGGLTGAYLGVLVGKRLAGCRVRTGDVFAPAVALGMAVGRIGCLLTEPPGRPTSLPWGITLSAEQIARTPDCAGCLPGVAMHPSFGYEIAFQLLAFGVLLWLRPRVRVPGALLAFYLGGYAVFRFLVEFTRDNQVVAAGLTRGQWFLLVIGPPLLVRVALLVRSNRSGRAPSGRAPSNPAPSTHSPATSRSASAITASRPAR
jgi:phosphatidylglycerol:prolipoprotein diacylglycerol transferase